ncbi:hybrid sensor histidine kinase/response regulator [Fischerella thermalis]|uniref:hybrid sensor histidine kinase/response regulator n=1 Tax=Fischerella thermalis TaxID=372787 RepID=UPI000C805373|nr:ATP-binding protein [Fischerella thermalis]PLZ80140.1 hybrid sensor histidine kinase/response regulator [Fischerella thermalis WC217]PLZ09081.1 hybrid sensor histidine kinase/response regulator [Fischerella thermalis WC114]PLZ09468.1 hybrid sensor histidine kinase/response regulator [Fischerella thermalis WC1110]PLZ15046.1 hybrid sensor histidine kinase/response regulator [Fischerella thermalis WC119]PLZ18682.1 hybrid sensor histidine kinase/response regulator [Fischerella thermalis WC157]
MIASSIKILLIEDNLAEARLLQEFLKQAQSHEFTLLNVKRLGDALSLLSNCNEISCDFDVILLDLTLPDSEGLTSLPPLMSQAPTVPIVVLTNTNDDELAIAAVRQGAQDYLVKRQVNVEVLIRALRYAIERKHTLESLRAVNHALEIRVEERTAELVKAQELNQFKSEFVSMLSHDIRSPLNTILLAAGLLQNSGDKLSTEKKLNHYKLICSAIKNMTQLLDEASLLGKADSGRLEREFTLLNLQDFCHQLVEDAQLIAVDKRITVVFTTTGQPTEILSDENLLRHILGNLLSNAIKYSRPDSIVYFELRFKNQTVIFNIKDEGIGIPLEDQKQLFQPFYRANNVGSIPGTGLGLAIVKKCLEAHGGEITVNSEVGVGTTFTVTLPLIKG